MDTEHCQPGQVSFTTPPPSRQTTGEDDQRLAELTRHVEQKRAEAQRYIDNATESTHISQPIRERMTRYAQDELRHWQAQTPEQLLAKEKARRAERMAVEQDRRENDWRRIVAARGERYAVCTLGNFEAETDAQQHLVAALEHYAIDLATAVKSGRGLVLYGPSGTGKDHLLMGLMRKATLQDGLHCEWRGGPALWSEMRDRITTNTRTEGELLRPLIEADVLALSDPTAQGVALSEYQSGILYRILDERYSRRRPTWLTVNVANRAELQSMIGVPTTERLVDGALLLHCNWQSYRKPERIQRPATLSDVRRP